MVDPIETSDLVIYEHPAAVVSVADVLQEDEFEEVPFLWITRARWCAAPEIPFAEFRYHYGRILQPGETTFDVYPPLDLVGKFVRVVVQATVDGDPELRWYGKFATRTAIHHGTGDDADTPTGVQVFRAFGVLWLLDQEPVLKTYIDIGEDEPLKIDEGLPFNTDQNGAIASRGNRSGTAFNNVSDSDTHACFSQQARGALDWDAFEAVKYTLERLVPTDANEVPLTQWALANGTSSSQIDWYDIAVNTHGRTVKAILDDLIPRHRGLGYSADFNPETGLCEVSVFSFADADITLPSGAVLGKNQNQRTLDFDRSFDVDVVVNDVETGRYHRVIVEGDYQTTTFTQAVEYELVPGLLERDWTDDEATAYAAGASGEAWYAALTDEQKVLANQLARSNERFRNVFARYRLNKSSEVRRNRPVIRVYTGINDSGTEKFYWLAPDIDAETFDPETTALVAAADDYEGLPFWRDGARFRRQLPLFERYDYSDAKIASGPSAWKVGAGDLSDENDQPDYLQPFAFAKIVSSGTASERRFSVLHRLHETGDDPANGKKWSAGLQIPTTDPAVLLTCRPSQFLAKDEWAALSPTPAATGPEQDPAKNGGINPTDIFVTLCCELPRRIRAEKVIDSPAAGVNETVLRIEAPDCRCDWVCPYTVVEIRHGQMVKTTSGGFVRDDRDRLKDIARAAAEWYGKTRQTLRLTYKTLRPLFEVGWLIVDFGSLQKEAVNTVVTAIDLEFWEQNQPGRTTIETSYAALDIR